MRLSDAIRLGAMLKPQGFGSIYFLGATCALGAAYDAMGFLEDGECGISPETWQRVMGAFPLMRELAVRCPACDETPFGDDGCFATNIAHLNDDHSWSRERIADWVETIESPAPAPPCEEALMAIGVSR